MQKNDEIIISITDITSDGNGVGRYEGLAVFVPMTAVGDTALVHIVKVKKTYAYGKLISVQTPSKDRILNDCPVFNRCGGCVYRHINYTAECNLKHNHVENCIKRIGTIDIDAKKIIPAKAQAFYRNKAQFPISQNGNVGFFANRSHRIIECDNCLLQPEEFSTIAKIVSAWIKKFSVSVYDEVKHMGLLRHLYLRKGEKTGEIMVVLVINGDTIPHFEPLKEELIKAYPENIKSIQLNINKLNTNVILGKECVTLYGESYINDILCGVKVRISALSFYQVNHDMTEILYKQAARYVQPEKKNILDLYCGAGTIGLSMAKQAQSIIGVEIIPEAILDAKQNAVNNNIENARFICADAAQAAKQLSKENIHPDVVILDPPRKGCEESLLKTVAEKFSPQRIVYVSCDPATLARDCAVLKKFEYKLKEYTPVDLFPRTGHVETVSLFLKSKE